MSIYRCPRCGNDDEHLIHYIEIRGQFDEPIIMHCTVCGLDWPRYDAPDRRHTVAKNLITRWAALEKEREEERDARQ